jgi:hypothetical protein
MYAALWQTLAFNGETSRPRSSPGMTIHRLINTGESSSALAVQVDGQTPESWSGILASFADASIYQSWAYGAVRWGERNLSHVVLRRDGEVVAAAQLRIARLPLVPAGLAYLRWGQFERRGSPFDSAVVAEMVRCLRQEYVDRRGLALQIIPPAYCEGDHAAAFCSALEKSGLRLEGSLGRYRTIVVDLSPAADVMRKRLDQKWRNQLNSAEKLGVALETSDTNEAYREFVPLYASMWARKQFETPEDVEGFGRIQERLSGSDRLQTFLARSDGQVIGALICSLMGDRAICLLAATNERARKLKAAYLLQWQAMLWLKQHGAQTYDLGGVDPEANPGGFHFKNGFGGADMTQLGTYLHDGNLLSSGVAPFAKSRRRPRSAAAPTVPPASLTIGR